MEISRKQTGNLLEVKVAGRLDGYWANHLSQSLSEMIREGAHRIRLDMSDVAYLSSAGIGVLVQVYRQLKEIHGSFAVISPSKPVRTVIELAKLHTMLIAESRPPSALLPRLIPLRYHESERATMEVFEYIDGGSMKCGLAGDPGLLSGSRFGEADCRMMRFPDSTVALGLGAFGSGFADCRGRFGEFLAVAGAAAYLPTDGTNVPDYLLGAESLVPEVQVLYGISCEGEFSHLARFEAKKEAGSVGLVELVADSFEIAGSDRACIVMVVESAGLTGAALRRSPALDVASGEAPSVPFGFPQTREWLSFMSERVHAGCLTLLAGIAVRDEAGEFSPFIRPLGGEGSPRGHFHAAVFSYRHLKKGELNLRSTVETLFDGEALRDVLHLLADDRGPDGFGESEFVRGACWIAPIAEISK